MFRNYFKTAFRFLLKNKTFSFINIIGLSIGTLCCLYILLYVEDRYIVYLFSKKFTILIAIAFVVATPIAWYYMHNWLQDYVYRIDPSWWIFLAGGIAAIVIAIVTISFQAIKAALANPVVSLRTE
jgi:hypothetical protein